MKALFYEKHQLSYKKGTFKVCIYFRTFFADSDAEYLVFSQRSKLKNNEVISASSFSGLRLGRPGLRLDRPRLRLDRPGLRLGGPGRRLGVPSMKTKISWLS